ncbi:helix-turn-helix transcriptional regulator [Yinghuangia seranimata]|nr:helix-turn-helix transcriptional regulator [Yinghuangia seranimata]MDI2130872.1 helix-turn-helix transcriptional regulator [Yinghuangia seranimata]
MSQNELALTLDVTRAAVSAWVTGRAEPRPDKKRAIAAALGLDEVAVTVREETPTQAASVTWYHRPAHVDGGREFGNPAAFAFDADLSVLAREATQNSLDERLDNSRPVRMRYTLHQITGKHLFRFLDAIQWSEIEPHVQAAEDPKRKTGRVIADGLREMRENSSLILLRIDDFNANGLTGSDYDDGRFAAVVRRQLDSSKSSGDTAGGSYGLGKATLWATSRLGLVLINSTLSETHEGRRERRMIGRLDLPWHVVDGREWAGPGWFGEPDRTRGDAARSWWADTETAASLHLDRPEGEPGTSFLIVGAHDASGDAQDLPAMRDKLVRSLADDFWAAMTTGGGRPPLLEVTVVTRRDDEEGVEERVDPHVHAPVRARALRAFLNGETVDAITGPTDVARLSVSLVLPARKAGARGDAPTRHDAVLLVTPCADDDRHANHITAMRGNRMTVVDRRIGGAGVNTVAFQAVLLAGVAAGDASADLAAERLLRTSEPPEHNAWRRTDDLTASYVRGAATRIAEFLKAADVAAVTAVARPEPGGGDMPAPLRDILRLDAAGAGRTTGYPTVKDLDGHLQEDGAWRIRVEVRLPERPDAWHLVPKLRFAVRGGGGLPVEWATLVARSNCTVEGDGSLTFTPLSRSAVFEGVSDPTSHPIEAALSVAQVDLARAVGGAR